LKIILSKKR